MGITTVAGSTTPPLDLSDDNNNAGAGAPTPRVPDDQSVPEPVKKTLSKKELFETVINSQLKEEEKRRILAENGIPETTIDTIFNSYNNPSLREDLRKFAADFHISNAVRKLRHAGSIGARETRNAIQNGRNFLRRLAGKPLVGYNNRKRLEHVARVAEDRAGHAAQVAPAKVTRVVETAIPNARDVAARETARAAADAASAAKKMGKKAEKKGSRLKKSFKKRL